VVASSAQQACDLAARYTTCEVARCLQYVRTWLVIPAGTPSASDAWRNATRRHPGDRTPPKGAPVFWTGGSHGYGHIVLAMDTNGRVRSTDVTAAGLVSTVDLGWFDVHWPALHYEGWAEDLNGVLIPYLTGDSQWASGDVYVAKLVRGQQDSDSVSRLRYRLTHHDKMPKDKQPGGGNDYGQKVVDAVRYWQRNIDPQSPSGPQDGVNMSNGQANRLFGPNYVVHEE
jgi:hypothetical protein